MGKRPEQELYRISEDPYCMHNLIADPETGPFSQDMKDQLMALLEDQQDPRIAGGGAVFDGYVYSDESSRDFYNRFMSGEEMNAGWVEPSDFEPDPVE